MEKTQYLYKVITVFGLDMENIHRKLEDVLNKENSELELKHIIETNTSTPYRDWETASRESSEKT